MIDKGGAVTCRTCDDWTTVVVTETLAEGVVFEREIPCPDHTAPAAEGAAAETSP